MSHEGNPIHSNNQEKVLMPPQSTLLGKIAESGIFGEHPEKDERIKNFTEFIAKKNVNPGRIHLGWGMYMQEGFTPEGQLKLDKRFDAVVDIISPTKEFAEEAKLCRKEFVEEYRKTDQEIEVENALELVFVETPVYRN